MASLRPCLWFDNQAEEAAEFYTGLFPNSRITRVVRYRAGSAKAEGSVLGVDFELDGAPFQALNGGPAFAFTEAISFVVELDSQAEIDRVWDAMLDSGGVASQCGWIKDRYGLSWQIVPRSLGQMLASDDRAAAQRATEAMLGMVRLDMALLAIAFAGDPKHLESGTA
ncbi:VOC family protein [Salinibacterium hongtaonis]|uniref:PhnB-like domain-containing protein n=1 Tax=Homoserinimonas hongtaonis TaxID=2079791 RepID=A0A2U1T3D6_9MICO|nr:VOC family protein [Salinibacterium hongtaonis]PWB98273.1 hypothetical protein DF220_10865 [Salinibacterium hongtaonis]